MTELEYKKLKTLLLDPDLQKVSTSELTNKDDRTLLFGYDADRNTHHVYLQDGELHICLYNNREECIYHRSGDFLPLEGITPNKRLYPEACDLEFCALLQQKGVPLPFTVFDESRQEQQFHGKVA